MPATRNFCYCGSPGGSIRCCGRTLNSKAWTGVPKKMTIASALIDLKLALQKREFAIAETIAERILVKVPTHPTAHYLLGMSAFMKSDSCAAVSLFRKAFSYGLKDPEAHFHFANIVGQNDYHHLALQHLHSAVDIKPNYRDAWLMGYQLAKSFNDDNNAIYFSQGLVNNFPEVDLYWSYAANAYHSNIEDDKAITTLRTGLKQFPESSIIQLALAGILEVQHKLEEAQRLLSRVLSENPDKVDALILQARILRRNNQYESAFDTLSKALKTNGEANTPSNLYAEYIKLFQINSDYENVWEHALKMNQSVISERLLQGNWTQVENQLAELENSDELLNANASVDVQHDLSIAFVIGFPRTGSTLIEKLLVNNFDCISASESNAFPSIEKSIFDTYNRPWWQLTPVEFKELDILSLDCIAKKAYGVEHIPQRHTAIVDKNLFNVLRLPLIEKLYPNASVIRVIRHPLDTLVSCYLTNFQSSDAWHTNLQQIALYLAAVDKHWHHISPKLRVKTHIVKYEDLVKKEIPQSSLKNMLSNEWKSLDNLSTVKYKVDEFITRTASYEQVRQEIHTKSIDTYKNYLEYIDGDSIDALRDMMERYGYVL